MTYAGDGQEAPQADPHRERGCAGHTRGPGDRERENAFDERLPELHAREEQGPARSVANDELGAAAHGVVVDQAERTVE